MKKFTFFSALCLSLAVGVRADSVGQEKRMCVTMKSGHTYTFTLEPGLCIHLERPDGWYPDSGPYGGSDIAVTSGADTLYSMADVSRFSFLGDFSTPPTGVEQVRGEVEVRLQEDGISLSGCDDKTVVRVYGADGRLLYRTVAHGGACFVSRNELPKGALIIKVNNKTVKLINR